MVGALVGVVTGSSVSAPRVGSAVGEAAGASVSDTYVGSTVGEAAGSSVSGGAVGSGSVELGDGAMGVAFPSEERAAGRERSGTE